MKKNVNFEAYASIEQLSSYKTRESLTDYRNARLSRYQPVVDFVVRKAAAVPISVLEIGSGSSALLYAIARRKLLEKGMGIELSRSRHEFAELWKQEDLYDIVQNVNGNFVDVDMGEMLWDWFIVIDNTFTYLYPEDPEYPALLLKKAFRCLKEGGRVVLDFFNYSKRTPEVEHRQWAAFSSNDPYSYGLYMNKISNGVNCCESIFIRREGGESRKDEVCKVYSLEDISSLLDSCGFSVHETFATFDEQPFVESQSERLVVVARKRS